MLSFQILLHYYLTNTHSNGTDFAFFSAYFQLGFPIYSAQYVRFRMGHPKNSTDTIGGSVTDERCPEPADDKSIWTYTSEMFPMVQVSSSCKALLQNFGNLFSSS